MQSPTEMVTPEKALPGRDEPIVTDRKHLYFNEPFYGSVPSGLEAAYVAMGCFWGAEKAFFTVPGVVSTSVGYMGGYTKNPTYQECCSGLTGHTETVRVVFDPAVVSYDAIIRHFFEGHDPTQGMRQGADRGTQYRSAVFFTSPEQERIVREVASQYEERLLNAGYGKITTEISPAKEYYFAEEYHQQYLVANPNGYCGIGGTGVSCPVGLGAA
jgi:peptide-methionine (S)-S-oxide reductase